MTLKYRRRLARGQMRKAASAALMFFSLAAVGPARAMTLVYEPFTYDAGTLLDGTVATGQNLTGSYTALGTAPQQKLLVESPGLNYGNLIGAPAAAGNRISDVAGVTSAGGTVSLDQPVVVDDDEVVFWSALFTFDDSTGGNRLANIAFSDDDTGDQLSFGEPIVGVRAVRIEANTAASGSVAAGSDNAFSDGDTLLLVGRYFNGASATSDSLELIGYDTADADALPSIFDPTDPNAEFTFALSGLDIDLAKITSISFTIRGDADNFIDELRIGTTYSSVVPEPSSAVLLLAGLVGLVARRPAARLRSEEARG